MDWSILKSAILNTLKTLLTGAFVIALISTFVLTAEWYGMGSALVVGIVIITALLVTLFYEREREARI